MSGLKLGDIDVAAEIVELNYQLHRTQLLLDIVVQKIAGMAITRPTEVPMQIGHLETAQVLLPILTPAEVTRVDDSSLEWLQKKFPTMGIAKAEKR